MSMFAKLIIPVSPFPATYLGLPDAYMAGPEWKPLPRWGPAAVTETDISGPGVQFDFTGLTGSTGIADEYPCNIPGAISNDDLTGFTHYAMYIENVGTQSLDVQLFMNTGYGGWPVPDCFWAGPWITINPTETKLCFIDFSAADPSGAYDDPTPAWRVPDHTLTNIKRLDEVTKIGIQVGATGDGTASIVVTSHDLLANKLYVDPLIVVKEQADVCTNDFTVDIVFELLTVLPTGSSTEALI